MPATLLIVEDERNAREGLRALLEDDYDVYVASNAPDALRLLDEERFDIVLTDLRLGGASGMDVIDRAITLPHKPVVIMMTAHGTVQAAVDAMKRGATDFLTKPFSHEQLELSLKRALRERKLVKENRDLHKRLDRKFSPASGDIIGDSPALRHVIEQAMTVAASKATVLLLGETGTGKEVVAQAIHQNSPRSREPFVAVHCEALNQNLLESELFGHEKGAFTGAEGRRTGRFEEADKGTLFLDEIGEINAPTQVKLLRFLETRSFERLGSSKPIAIDVRLVAATNRDLQQMVREGKFREDLFYRLNVVPLVLPPLRDRREDIPLLLGHFVSKYASEYSIPPPTFTPAALSALQAYRWPGNIRELRNFAENSVVMRQGRTLDTADLDPRFTAQEPARAAVATEPPTAPAPGMSSAQAGLNVGENEKRLIREALVAAHGNKTLAAERLGISRRTLHRKIAAWPDLEAGIR